MSNDETLKNVNWDDTPFITFDLADIMQLPEKMQDQFDRILVQVGRIQRQRNPEQGVNAPLHNALVVPQSHPSYAAARLVVEGRSDESRICPLCKGVDGNHHRECHRG